MVFESLVVELINRYLGDFVENLDTKQLKIGIWGGDVVLNNLHLKESALDDLDLPVKIKAGHIGKLVLKIPWKNLYKEAVVAEIDGIYALAIPNVGIKYNAEREEAAKQSAKQKKLAQIEEAKKLEAQKGKQVEEKPDTFAEKLATQVIKNLQVKVSNIHVRYEDRFTNPKRPFSIGFTMQELLFQTTDENWKPCVIKDAVTQIYKLVKLDSLSVYWNSCSQLLDGLEKEQILEELKLFQGMPADSDSESLKTNIASQGTRTEYQYVVRPISSVAHLRLNTKPEQTNFTIPKIGLTIVFDEIAVGLTKDQYDDVLEMMESMERMNLLSLYRKYRPSLPLPGNSRVWWHYAYNSVMEETVRRRRRMWSWQHMSQHRQTMKRYREAYVKKLDSKKVPGDVQKKIEECEQYLDVFCITIMRQQAEVEAAKLGAKRKESSSSGWFGGWFGGGSKKKEESKKGGATEEIQEKFYELYTPEEKAKLYSAIGYEENESDLTLPVEYVAVKVVTKLRNVAIFLRDTRQREAQVLKLQLKDVYSAFGQRPAASAIQLDAKVDKMVVSGTPQKDFVPRMITSHSQTSEKDQVYSLLTVSLETNPLDGKCDTRVKVTARPLEIIYDAQTVNKLASFFKPPESVQLKQFSQAAMAQFEEMKEMSATGMQHAIEQHKYTDISVDLASSYVMVPQGGIMKNDVHMLVLDLGHLSVDSEKHKVEGDVKLESLETKMEKAYDKFNIKLQRIQLLFVHPGDKWQAAREEGHSSMHILAPISILLDLGKCIFDKEPRMAKMKVSGVLPNISVTMSDTRLKEILDLVQSIPLPESPPPVEEDELEDLFKGPSNLPTVDLSTTHMITKQVNIVATELEGGKKPELQRGKSLEQVNFIDMELKFEIREVLVAVNQIDKTTNTEIPLLKVLVERIGVDVKMRTFDMLVNAYLGAIYVQHLKYKLSDRITQQLKSVGVSGGPLINLVNSPTVTDASKHLLAVTFLQANKKGPEFATTYANTEQSIEVTFSALELLLHQGAILSLLEFAQNIAPAPASAAATGEVVPVTSHTATKQKPSEHAQPKPVRKRRVKEEDLTIINLKVVAVLHEFSVGICNEEKLITDIQIKGIQANVAMMKQKMEIGALLRDMAVLDPDPNTKYHKIMQIEGSEVLKADVVVYSGGTEGEKYADMKCVDTSVSTEIGCIKIVFVNKFVNDLLAFADNFQAAKDKMAEASQVAAQAGMEAAKSLQETAARLGLHVQMKAPVIIVPQNSASLNTILLDLGQLSVTNAFRLAGKSSASGVPAVLEEMKIVLTSLKLSRAHVQDDGRSVQAECQLLEPVTIALTMQRNLSAAWYHDKPDIDISGALEPLTVRLSQGDFKTMMQVLDENMNEGKPVKSPQEPQAAAVATDDAAKPAAVEQAPGDAVAKQQSTEVHTQLQVDFQVKGLTAVFYSGESTLTRGVCGHDPHRCLGKFELQVVAVGASIKTDTSIAAKVSLQDTILDDLRPSKQAGITRMIERSKGAGAKSRKMILVDFSQDAEQNKNVKLEVSTLYICVCVEFLMTLADFFTKGMPQASSDQPKPAETAVTSASQASVAKEKETPAPAVGSMDVVLAMEKPEIILIEDQMNHKTNALVVDMELSFRMRQNPDVQTMNAGLSALQIFSCTFDKRHMAQQPVLMPCNIDVVSSAPQGRNPHMDVSISDIVLNITPATIRTITAVSSGMAPPSEEGDQKQRESLPSDLWAIRKLADCGFWFVKLAKDAGVVEPFVPLPVEEATDVGRGEELMLGLPSLVVKLEGGIGHRTIPLLIVEASFQAQVRDWSTKLSVEGSLDLEVAYYNEKLAVWEPLIEPVIEDNKSRRWQLGLEVSMPDEMALTDDVGPDDEPVLLPSKMVINVTSSDTLQVSITKGCLEVLTNLGKAFNDAYNLVELEGKTGEVLSPFLFKNNTGYEILLKLDPSFEPPPSSVQNRVKLSSDAPLQVYNKKEAAGATKASLIKATQEGDERKIIFQVEQFGATREVTIKRAEKRLFQINQRSHQGDVWSVVCTTDCKIGQKIISLQSIVQVRNNLTFPVEVFYQGDTKKESCGVASPDDLLSLPLGAVYSLSSELFFRPVGPSYEVSQKAMNWRSAENTGQQEMCCPSTQKGHSACYFNVCPEVENIYFEAGEEMTAKTYTLCLQPTMILHNLLPLDINYMLEGTSDQESLAQGENRALTHASLNESTLEIIQTLEVVIPSYQGLEWVGRRKLQKNSPQLTVWEFTAQKGAQKLTMELGLHSKVNKGTIDISLFCPYWLLNKAGVKLAYRGSDQDIPIEHSPDTDQLILFSFKGRSFFGGKKKEKEPEKTDDKKSKDKVREMKQAGKAQLRIQDLDWSDKFSMDTVGSSGTVQCKSKSQTAEVGVSITLSSSGLTKIVTFTPFYMFLNKAEIAILVTETGEENWQEVSPGQCLPFWPKQSGKEITVKSKVKGTNDVTGPFHINKAHTTLVKLLNEYGGINADCQVSESSMITTLQTYRPGFAAVQIVNNTDRHTVTFYQSGHQQQVQKVGPQEALLYSWDDALGKRELVWSCGTKENVKTDLLQDGMDEFFVEKDSKVYWVSFLDGLQRFLMFTEDIAVAASAQEAGELERVEQEINLQLQGLGLSLVDNYTQHEVAFLGITSSGIIWEERKKRRYKALKLKDCIILEAAWQKYQNELAAGKTPSEHVTLENKMEVDFTNMLVTKPRKFGIRRSFENGIWVQYKTSPHQLQLHAKINRIQLDNQLSHAVFPTVLSPLPPPKSVAAESVPKPFTEVSVMMRKHEHSNVQQIKYFKVLIQEMRVSVDQGFLNAILQLFAANEPLPREQETIQFKEDVAKTEKTLIDVAGLSLAEEQKNFYDYLHFSPIKVHLSFSLQTGTGSSDGKPTEIQAGVINVFLQSVGVVLTDVQDVVFKLGYFERSHAFYNQSQLTGEMTQHYAGQAIKQMYVLVLGLDVLGNPFGLLRGLSEGIEDLFYEPYQGAIQGPEEFAEGLALGVRSLFGHAVGGAAGAVSRITGTVGKGLAALTLDDDYQKKRREQLNKRPANAREGFARGGKGLVMGVFDGVTGIVRKPVEGAKQEGVSGFFKGVGKGLVGVVTRPTSGVIDFASSSFEGIRRIAEVQDEIRRLRPPRRFFKDKVIRPYNHQEAEGYAILQELEKGKYATTDEYQAHVVVSKDGKNIFLVTDKRLVMAKRGEIFGAWDCEWTYVWSELKEPPKKIAKGVEIILKEKEKKKFFSSSATKKDVIIIDPKLSEWIINKIQEQMARLK